VGHPLAGDLPAQERARERTIYVQQDQPWYEILKNERIRRGWSQRDVARKLGSVQKSIGRWERGQAFPDSFHRQKLAALYGLSVQALGLMEKRADLEMESQSLRQEEWGEAPEVRQCYGRAAQIDELTHWILSERCRLVTLLGMGGIGKTTLALVAARRVQQLDPFAYLYWRSLQNAPPVASLLEHCLQSLYAGQPLALPATVDEQISLLIAFVRQNRCLLILDNIESVLQQGPGTESLSESEQGYIRLFQRFGETRHESCLLLTSREKPRSIAYLEGRRSPVRSLRLRGIERASGQELLQHEGLIGTDEAWAGLVARYWGNPLALRLVSEPVREIFGGDIAAFLEGEECVLGEISDLLEQQFLRLSPAERDVIYWLAIEHSEVSLETLQEDMHGLIGRRVLIETLDALRRRSLVESSADRGFLLQPVVMEYVIARFVQGVSQEIAGETFALVASHALLKTSTVDYIRKSQVHFILEPIVQRLHAAFWQTKSEQKLRRMLTLVHTDRALCQSYAAGNILNLLIHAHADLRGLDFSQLTVRQADLQGVRVSEVNFASADLTTCRFTDTFSSVLCLAVSSDGALLAGGSTTDEIRVWQTHGMTALFCCPGHTDGIRALAFSPDNRTFASGSEDHTLRIWECTRGRCLRVLPGHSDWIFSLAFSPDGRIIASASLDQTVRLWNTTTGDCQQVLDGHSDWVRAVTFSPNGAILASGGNDGTIRLWESSTGICLRVLQEEGNWVRTLAFSPDGTILASAGEDQRVRFWHLPTGECSRVLQRHVGRIRSIAWTSDGALLASGGDDLLLCLWDAQTGQCLKVLQGHRNRIWSLVFLPASAILVSASEDDTLRFWDVRAGQCTRTLQGQTHLIKAIAFSPDGRTLVSGSEDQLVRVWERASGQCTRSLRGHANRVRAVAFSPSGSCFASGSEDETIYLWDAHSGQVERILQGHSSLVRSLTFRADGKTLASGSYDQTIRLWDVESGCCLKKIEAHSLIWSVAFHPHGRILASGNDAGAIQLWDAESGQCLTTLADHTRRVWSVAFHPAGTILAGSGDDLQVSLWHSTSGRCLHVLHGHTSWVRAVAFSADGTMLASGSHDKTVRLWDVESGRCLHVLHGHTSFIWSVAFSPLDDTLASAGDDGCIKIWESKTGRCIQTLRSARLYEGTNIAGAQGLTDSQKTSLQTLGAVELF